MKYSLGLFIVMSLCLLARHKRLSTCLTTSLSRKPQQGLAVWIFCNQLTCAGPISIHKYSDGGSPIGFWHPAASSGPGPGYYPYIAYNTTKQSQAWPSPNGWVVGGGEVAMEGSNCGQYSLVRFVAPVAGTYKISAQFAGVHVWSTTDVHVLHNATSLFDADIDGYGGDPAFRKVQGANPTASIQGRLNRKPTTP